MSRSIHVTIKNFKGLTKKELDEQAILPDSDLNQWAEKKHIKKDVEESRKQKRVINKLNKELNPDE